MSSTPGAAHHDGARTDRHGGGVPPASAARRPGLAAAPALRPAPAPPGPAAGDPPSWAATGWAGLLAGFASYEQAVLGLAADTVGNHGTYLRAFATAVAGVWT